MSAASPPSRIALDSVVIIDALQKKVGRFEWIKPIIQEAEQKALVVIVSSMAIAETIKVDGTSLDEAQKAIQAFFASEWVVPIAVSIFIAEQAQEIQRNHAIDCADAIHLATALIGKAPIFLTNDGDYAFKKKRKKKPILALDKKVSIDGGAPIRIMTPEAYHAMQVTAHNPLFTPIP